MSLTCPNCQNPIADGGAASPAADVVCGVCGSSVRSAADVTVSAVTSAGVKRLGRFELGERVGAGAFGAVFRARDSMLGRTVAIKVPHLPDLTNSHEVERFMREARSV